MPQIKLLEERYEQSVLKRDETQSVTTSLVAAAIDRLDGKRCSMLSLTDDSTKRVLIIGGGADGVYVAVILIDTDKAFFRLVRSTAISKEKQKLVVGGQAGLYRADECVNREEVGNAAKAFMDDTELSGPLTWEKY
jgi:hypothetical protein